MSLNGWLALAAIGILVASPILILLSPLWILWYLREQRRRRRDGWKVLLPFMARTLAVTAEAMIRRAPPQDGWMTVARAADDYLAWIPLTRRWRAQLVVIGVQILPLLYLRAPLTWQSPERRRAFLDRTLTTTRGLAGLVSLSRQLARMGYYADRDVQERIGFREMGERARIRAETRQRAQQPNHRETKIEGALA